MGWEFYEAPHSYVVRVENPSQAPGFPRWRPLTTFRKGNPDSEANARLIAAAPDLLEALEAAARFIADEVEQRGLAGSDMSDYQDEATQALERVEAAIAKARGRA